MTNEYETGIKSKYDVYFEIYGKKMKATVKADSPAQAKEIIKSKINFHKISDACQHRIREQGHIREGCPTVEELAKMMGMKI